MFAPWGRGIREGSGSDELGGEGHDSSGVGLGGIVPFMLALEVVGNSCGGFMEGLARLSYGGIRGCAFRWVMYGRRWEGDVLFGSVWVVV